MKLTEFYTNAGIDLASQQPNGTAFTITSAIARSGHTSPSDSALALPEHRLTLGFPKHKGKTLTFPVTLANVN